MSINPKTIIDEVDIYLSQNDNRIKMYSFLEKFFQCEVYVRPVLKQYYKEIGEEKEDKDIVLDAREIKDALTENGIYIDDKQLITRVFGAEQRSGISSCRWLRNKITHELMRRAVKEACDRSEELISDMNSLINQIKEQQ